MHTKNREKGASAVEFALILPVLMLILFGIIEFGFVLYDKAVITNASREAARKGIVFHEPGTVTWDTLQADMQSTVSSYAAGNLVSFGADPSSPSTVIAGNCFTAGSALTVTVSYPYTFLVLPSFLSDLAGGVTLSAATIMNCENQ